MAPLHFQDPLYDQGATSESLRLLRVKWGFGPGTVQEGCSPELRSAFRPPGRSWTMFGLLPSACVWCFRGSRDKYNLEYMEPEQEPPWRVQDEIKLYMPRSGTTSLSEAYAAVTPWTSLCQNEEEPNHRSAPRVIQVLCISGFWFRKPCL